MIDHLVFATSDLGRAVDDVAARCGVRPTIGGNHVGWGTRNALLSLGPSVYFEVIGPDEDALPTVGRGRPFGIDEQHPDRLAAWAWRVDDVDRARARLLEAGHDPGPVMAMDRERPDGSRIGWRLTVPPMDGVAVVPFLIQWEPGVHPAEASPAGCRLESLRVEHPRPSDVAAAFPALDIDVPVERGITPRLLATLATPNGDQEFC